MDSQQLHFWFWKVDVDVALPDLAPEGRVVRVQHVGMDEYAVHVRYELVPPLEQSLAHQYPMYGWLLSARDDLGTVYDDGGGAVGRSFDGRRAEGIRSLMPMPPAGAAWLGSAHRNPTSLPAPDRHSTLVTGRTARSLPGTSTGVPRRVDARDLAGPLRRPEAHPHGGTRAPAYHRSLVLPVG
jgi:hypothetical protein